VSSNVFFTDCIEDDDGDRKDYENTALRARANSTFQTVKYLARWIRTADRRRVSAGGTPITEEDDDEDAILEEDISEEEMLEFFRSLQMANLRTLEHLPCPNEDDLVIEKENDCVEQPSHTAPDKMDKEAVRKTVKFVTSWMHRVEESKKKSR